MVRSFIAGALLTLILGLAGQDAGDRVTCHNYRTTYGTIGLRCGPLYAYRDADGVLMTGDCREVDC